VIPGLWPVVDAETGETVLVDLSDARTPKGVPAATRGREWTSASGSSDTSRSRRSGSARATTTSLPLAALFRARARRRSA